MPLESYHNTPPDASFSGTGSSAWVEAHNLRMEGGGFLVGRETAGTGAPESIAVGANLTLSGGTLSASGGTAAAGVSLVQGVAPILVGGTATSTVSIATSGVTAGTYGGPLVIPRFDVSAQGLIQSASPAGTIGTMASFNSYVSAGDALGTSTTGTLTVALSTTGVTAGTYGNGTAVSQVVVDAKGRVTSASNVNISFPAAGGTSTFALAGDVLGTGLVPGTLTSALSTTGITAGTYGGTAGIPRFDIDAKGRMLSAASHPLQGSAPIAITTGAGTFVVSHNTSGVAAGTFGTGNDLVQLAVNALGHVTSVTTSGTIGTMGRFSSYTMAGAALGTSTTGTMTVALSTTGVTAGTYGDATNVGQFTVDAGGRITLAANVNIAGAGTLAVVQGTTTVSTVNRIVFTTNATVTSTAAGIADVAVVTGTGGSSTWDTIGAAAGDGTTSNTTHRIVYQVAATGDSRISWRFTESVASSGGTSTSGVPNQVLLQLDTVAASTMSPLKVLSRGSFVFAVSPTAAQILVADGSSSVPSIAFAGDANTGMFRASGNLVFIRGGAQVLGIGPSQMLAMASGTAGSPIFALNIDPTTGLWFSYESNRVFGLSIEGVENTRFRTQGVQFSKAGANAVSYTIDARKSRGTVASPTVITTGDDLLTISGYGYVGSTNTYQEAARITLDSTGTISDSTTGIGGIIRLLAAKVGAELAEIVRFTAGTTTGGGWMTLNEADANPGTADLADGDEAAVYMKAGNIVFAQNVAGTINFLYAPLDGATTTWTANTTGP